MIGGFHETPVTQEHQALVQKNLAGINNLLHGHHATSFHVDQAWTQVVAGTNYFFHLTSNSHKQYSVCIFVPLPHTNGADQVTLVEEGFTPARNPN
jgi:hypothetical protein